jgi:hypothetical protein
MLLLLPRWACAEQAVLSKVQSGANVPLAFNQAFVGPHIEIRARCATDHYNYCSTVSSIRTRLHRLA